MISQDPFGLFRLRRRFLESKTFTVLPAAQSLPDMDPLLANLPSDGRVNRHWDHITTDVASIRQYNEGDSYRRIHWPYTARMNSLMVKEFDIGLSSESWVVVDMEAAVHVGVHADPVVNTEKTAVIVAASVIARLTEFSLPVGLAVSGDNSYMHRPNTSPDHPGRLMETLAIVRAKGVVGLEKFLYDLRPSFSRFNTLTVVTPSSQTAWVPAIGELKRQGVNVRVVCPTSTVPPSARRTGYCGVSSSADGGRHALERSFFLAAAVMIVAFMVLVGNTVGPAHAVYEYIRSPLDTWEDDFNRLFAGLPARRPLGYRIWGDSMAFQGTIRPTTVQMLRVESPAPMYWKARSYGTYTAKGWVSEDTTWQALDWVPSYSEPQPAKSRLEVTYTVQPSYATRTLFAPTGLL